MNAGDTANSFPQALTNREMASLFFNIATVLRNSGNVNPFRTAAYERAARAMMGLQSEASEILSSQAQVPFRRRQHIGKKLQSKIREMTETGTLDQYLALLEELPVHQRNLMTLPGIGPKTADAIYATLGINSREELAAAARDGSLKKVPGFGPKRIALLSQASPPSEPRQLCLFDLSAGSRYNVANHEPEPQRRSGSVAS